MIDDDARQIIEGYCDWLKAGSASALTVKGRRNQALRFAEGHDLRSCMMGDINGWLAGHDWKPETRSSFRSALRSLFHWMQLAGIRQDNPAEGIPPVRVPPTSPKPVPEYVLRDALKDADDTVALILLLGGYAGLRISEIAQLHADDIGRDRMTILGKGGKRRLVPIHPALRDALEVRLQTHRGWLFPSMTTGKGHVSISCVHKWVKKALDGHSTHTLRHRFATQAYRGSHDIRAVQTLLGHSSVNTTQRYVAIDDDALMSAVVSVA